MASQRQKYIEKALADPRNLTIDQFIEVSGMPIPLLMNFISQEHDWILVDTTIMEYMGCSASRDNEHKNIAEIKNVLISKPRFVDGRDYMILGGREFSAIMRGSGEIKKSDVYICHDDPALRDDCEYILVSHRTLRTLCMLIPFVGVGFCDVHINNHMHIDELMATYIEYQRRHVAVPVEPGENIILRQSELALRKLSEIESDIRKAREPRD